MSDRIVLDYDNMLVPRAGARAIDPADLAAAADRFRTIHEGVERRRAAGELAFYALPQDSATVREIRDFAEGVGQAFDTVVVLGIGGSALGATALRQAVLKPFWNELDDEARDYFPRLYVLDNIDPTTIGPLLDRLDLARTLFDVVSKSGATAETMAQFLIVRDRLRKVFDDDDGYRRHLIFTTDPERGVLRRIAIDEAIATLPVPPGVGGRFSVLSAVGLLPAALVGVDVGALLAGAAAMVERCDSPELRDNPAGLFAVLQYLADTERDARIHVMMPYTDRLDAVADWFRQLWAESLGKRLDMSGAEVFRGPTPVKALGATDQHSQVQLYTEGPFDKTVTFLTARTLPEDLAIPRAYETVDELGYLGGRTLGELLDAERIATTSALTRQGRMNMTIELPAVTAHALGQLIMMLQIATVYAGALYDVNPLDQPGVELGKQLTYGLMGRPGFGVPEDEPTDPRNVAR
jgi:glucose-6-phosphate isomerase